MPYLIDGHNLIGTLPDIQLHDPDDEMQLVHVISTFFNRRRISGTIFFDQGAPGMEKKFRVSRVQVEFSTPPITADDAIQGRLRRLKKDASNYTVVSSDHRIQEAARKAGARIMSSEEFAQQVDKLQDTDDEVDKPQSQLSELEIQRWQKLFDNGSKKE